jgi:hypothetical protein
MISIANREEKRMSGYRRRWNSRDTTDGYRSIDVRYMQRQGILKAYASGSLHWSRRGERFASTNYRSEADRVVLSYRAREHGGEWESLEYPVFLEWTRCNFGGERAWFLCPACGCGKRVAVLYGGRIYACRQCHCLAYESQQQSPSDRATDQAWHLLEQLKCERWMTIFDSDPPRPKGMHKRTHARLSAKYERARAASLGRYGF